MLFKYSILSLCLIIVANSVLGETEDENQYMRDSYDYCRRWLGKSLNHTITKYEFLLYMGKNISDWYALDFYFINNPDANAKKAVIDLSLYGELFKYICNKHGRAVRNCAEYRKSKAQSTSYVAMQYLDWEDRE
ncbi:uncharacterized protein LOC126843376 [Adelges cooleyi]|uniref:uncharacterized protein LOC126843376 n=1 Tax=Adelges cooleyi TaxID=133065 RepID=UPI00217F9044|nr:uncharacterized protein LOC126843376 [Adelges cooleyi]